MKAKAKVIRRLLARQPMSSDRMIAALVGCEAKAVNRVRRDMLAAGELPRRDVDKALEGDI